MRWSGEGPAAPLQQAFHSYLKDGAARDHHGGAQTSAAGRFSERLEIVLECSPLLPDAGVRNDSQLVQTEQENS